MKKSALEFHKTKGVAVPNVDYVNDEYILKLLSAKREGGLKEAQATEGADITKPQGLKRAGARDQWSGYVSQVYYSDDQTILYFVTPCQAPQAYGIPSDSVVSITQNGICGNYTQYYLVYNM